MVNEASGKRSTRSIAAGADFAANLRDFQWHRLHVQVNAMSVISLMPLVDGSVTV